MSSKCSLTCICGIVLPLNPPATTVYARSAFYPNLHFTHSLHFTPGPQSAVCSLQSAFYTDRSYMCQLRLLCFRTKLLSLCSKLNDKLKCKEIIFLNNLLVYMYLLVTVATSEVSLTQALLCPLKDG